MAMKEGLTLVELAEKVERLNYQKKDFITETNDLRFVPQQHGPEGPRPSDEQETPSGIVLHSSQLGESFSINEHAHGQIAARLKIPKQYYDRLRHNHPDVLMHDVNTLFDREPERRMIRTMDGTARAFLSDKYRRIDNYQLLTAAILPELLDPKVGGEMKVVNSEVTDTRLYLRVVTPKLQGEVNQGDVIQGGFMFTNSEIGAGSVSLSFFMLRLLCTNGMVGQSLLRKYHVGRSVNVNENLMFSDETMRADDHTLMLKIRDMIRNALDEDLFIQSLEKMRGATEVEIERPSQAVEVLSNEFGFTANEQSSIIEMFYKNTDRDGQSIYAMSNAITAASEHAKSFDRAIELEQAGFKLLDSKRPFMEKIATAA